MRRSERDRVRRDELALLSTREGPFSELIYRINQFPDGGGGRAIRGRWVRTERIEREREKGRYALSTACTLYIRYVIYENTLYYVYSLNI